jgi:hypothetical protein
LKDEYLKLTHFKVWLLLKFSYLISKVMKNLRVQVKSFRKEKRKKKKGSNP